MLSETLSERLTWLSAERVFRLDALPTARLLVDGEVLVSTDTPRLGRLYRPRGPH